MSWEEKVRDLKRFVGHTPIMRLRSDPNTYFKLEYVNPTGSHKDRIAFYMIMDALNNGYVSPGETVIEASSGNTAIAVAWLCKLLGLKTVVVVEEGISSLKLSLIKSLGAEIVTAKKVPPTDPQNPIRVAERLAKENGWYFLNQNANEANVRAHYETTAKEIIEQLGRVDVFVMGVGTGGTVAGVAKRLKEELGSKVSVVAIVPKASPVARGSGICTDPIEGLACTTVPEIWLRYKDLVDEVIEVEHKEVKTALRDMILKNNLLAGPSTAANYHVAKKLRRKYGKSAKIVTIAADSAMRYPEVLKEVFS